MSVPSDKNIPPLPSKQDQIKRILDLHSSDQLATQPTQEVVYILNGMSPNSSHNMARNQYYELTKLKSHKRLNSNNGSGVMKVPVKPLFGSKEIIYIDLKNDDSLQKLALTFNCTVAEIKLANKIYADQDLFALKTIKIPVVKDGELHNKYLTEQDTRASSSENNSSIYNSKTENNFVESKYKFRVQSEELINPDLSYMTSESEDDNVLFDMPLSNETSSLLCENNIYEMRVGQPINEHTLTFNDYMRDMDTKIEHEIEKVEANKETLHDTVNSLTTTKIVFPVASKERPEKYGSIFSLTWGHCLCIICLVAVLIPLGYFFYYYKMKKH